MRPTSLLLSITELVGGDCGTETRDGGVVK
jgi:hypothetical protein